VPVGWDDRADRTIPGPERRSDLRRPMLVLFILWLIVIILAAAKPKWTPAATLIVLGVTLGWTAIA